MLRFLLSLFRRRQVIVVHTYSVKRTDLQLTRDLKHAELARECGKRWKTTGDRLNG